MKNRQIDLDNHLFAELERLSDEGLEGDALEAEIKRAKAVAGIASQVIAGRSLALEVAKFRDDARDAAPALPEGLR